MISGLIKPNARWRDDKMLAIESARIVKDESPRHTKGVSHLVIDGSREAEAFATILVAEHDRRDMGLPGPDAFTMRIAGLSR